MSGREERIESWKRERGNRREGYTEQRTETMNGERKRGTTREGQEEQEEESGFPVSLSLSLSLFGQKIK